MIIDSDGFCSEYDSIMACLLRIKAFGKRLLTNAQCLMVCSYEDSSQTQNLHYCTTLTGLKSRLSDVFQETQKLNSIT
ncbi:hypothetical protein S7335_3992 [Synechococcus sp. PCC 7335]|nr:hypothetical protein S7335_3992 [Synechococcus sp. PCC 7335]